MKIEINNLSVDDVKELNDMFNSWKNIKSSSDFSRWHSFFVNVDTNKERNVEKTEIKISDE